MIMAKMGEILSYYLASRIQTELLNIAYRLQVVVELKCPIFWETESIRIDSSSESNRIDSNRELECTNVHWAQYSGLSAGHQPVSQVR